MGSLPFTRVVILGLAALGVAATFLPWEIVPGYGRTDGRAAGYGWASLVTFTAVVPLVLVMREKSVAVIVGVAGAAGAAAGVMKIIDLGAARTQLAPYGLGEGMRVGTGPYVAIAVGAGIIACAVADRWLTARRR